MTLDEAIERYTSNAEYERAHGNLQGCLDFKKLAEWLKDYKRLLEQESCNDCISRADARHLIAETNRNALGYTSTKVFKILYDGIDKLPPVNSQPKTGRWEWVRYDSNPNIGNWHCSECRCVVVECVDRKSEGGGIPLYKYCPQCGCRIIEPQESEDEE